jgi:hypothetical protein
MKKLLIGVLALALVVVGAVFLVTSCENVQTAQDSVLNVNPAMLVVTGRVVATFSVSTLNTNGQLYLPLEWTVSDPELGTIDHSDGLTAVYMMNDRVGVNTITVRDQAGASGLAVVDQLFALGMGLSPSEADLFVPGTAFSFSVSNAAPETLALPLDWSVSDSSRGTIEPSGNLTAIYTSTQNPGNNIVIVRDQMGATASAVVRQSW